MISEKEWREACYYAVREDFNNSGSRENGQPRSSGLERNKKLDAKIRAGISAFLIDTMPYPSAIVELDGIYNAMRRRGIIDPRDPSNQQAFRFKGYAMKKVSA